MILSGRSEILLRWRVGGDERQFIASALINFVFTLQNRLFWCSGFAQIFSVLEYSCWSCSTITSLLINVRTDFIDWAESLVDVLVCSVVPWSLLKKRIFHLVLINGSIHYFYVIKISRYCHSVSTVGC
ncbi:hypothetical protein GCK32_007125 [Trichostrongylus colubriformis]|uniref:Uncharacterized protein n=1 Tax=Trichostrongylus colubriformis TaxID=6319 RepID=A0AAN8IPR6_TRICO